MKLKLKQEYINQTISKKTNYGYLTFNKNTPITDYEFYYNNGFDIFDIITTKPPVIIDYKAVTTDIIKKTKRTKKQVNKDN